MPAASELAAELSARGPRPGSSDAERRAAEWAAARLRADPRRSATIETVWRRPSAISAQLWHVALAVGGGLWAVSSPRPGAVVIFMALLAILADGRYGRSPGRLLTRERATQNVISAPPHPRRVRLILTANLDTAALAPRGRGIGWVAGLALGTLWLLGCAAARYEGSRGTGVAVLQLLGTAALIFASAALLLARAPSDNAGGVGAVLALTRLLDVAPPANLGVEVVLAGTGALDGGGLAAHLRRRRRELTVTDTVVLGFLDSPDAPGFLIADGPLVPSGAFRALADLAAADPSLSPVRFTGTSPALPARRRGLPALTLTGDPDRLAEVGLELVDRLDAYVGAVQARTAGSDRRDRVVLSRPVPRLGRRQREA